MSDAIFNRSNTLEGPYWVAAQVTPNDSVDLARVPTDGLYVGSAGDAAVTVEVVMAGGGTVLFEHVNAGTILPIRVDRVLATGTDAAANIIALYTN